jgi:hypothetical protein
MPIMFAINPSRRELLSISGGALALSGLSSRSQAYPAPALLCGHVRDAETGIGMPDVRVSNGRDIQLTDDEGRYSIARNGDNAIFVIKPAGWTAPLNPETMLPQIHRQPTTPEASDFALKRSHEADAFDVIMFADPQPGNDEEMGYLRAQLGNGSMDSQAAFGLTLGDLVGDNLSLFDRYNQIIAQIGLPWWNLPGNHDLDFSADTSSQARAPWRRVFGPTTYAFEHGAATFIMLDNINWRGRMATANPYCGEIGQDNLAFVEALLKTTPHDRLIVLCMHIPLISAAEPKDPGSNTSDADALLALIADRPCVSFAGHMHTTEHHYLPLPGGALHHHHILTALSGSWWSGPMDPLGRPMAQSCDGAPNGWHILSIVGNTYSTRFVSGREPAQMRIMLTNEQGTKADHFASSGIPTSALANTKILVNIFDGGPRTRVDACVSGCSPTVMARAARPDPLTEKLFLQAGATKKPWVRAETSSHIWEAALPMDLACGLHRLNVTAINEYGKVHQGMLIFEVTRG